MFHTLRERYAPLLKESKFKETGVLTPEEFVLAGDFLVYKCPTWAWSAGTEGKRRDYLPADKQYLITRNVPCLRRVKAMEYTDEDVDAETLVKDDDGDEEWVATHHAGLGEGAAGAEREIVDDEEEEEVRKLREGVQNVRVQDDEVQPDLDDIPDIDDEMGIVEEDDPAAVYTSTKSAQIATEEDKILKTRTYDMSITYDKYWQTPRVWLFGYDEFRQPLTSQQIFEDISQDHALKTVTIEAHPHEDVSLASIHPCKHSNVMKRIIDHWVERGNDSELRVDQYLFLFLKFMSAVLPTMEYDYTGSMEG
ncbi:autophagocytosis associated protein [Cladochytrium replicatum]|nr:autophagocytosis associated protein [Cladochytrium replicatum]